jgi:hypothetical protein
MLKFFLKANKEQIKNFFSKSKSTKQLFQFHNEHKKLFVNFQLIMIFKLLFFINSTNIFLLLFGALFYFFLFSLKLLKIFYYLLKFFVFFLYTHEKCKFLDRAFIIFIGNKISNRTFSFIKMQFKFWLKYEIKTLIFSNFHLNRTVEKFAIN